MIHTIGNSNTQHLRGVCPLQPPQEVDPLISTFSEEMGSERSYHLFKVTRLDLEDSGALELPSEFSSSSLSSSYNTIGSLRSSLLCWCVPQFLHLNDSF